MKLHSSMLRNSLLFFAAILLLGPGRMAAQAKPDSSASFAQTQAVSARITQAIDETQLVRLQGNVHPLARPEFDQGPVSDAQPMNRMLLLLQRSPAQEAALRQLMDDQQTPGSANYHAWMTPEQFGKEFGPADADIQAVTDWLTAQGFTGIKAGPGRNFVEFSGNAGQIRRAFHTEIHGFNVNGEAHMANVSDPQIPAALSPVVAGVMSLHNFRRKSHLHKLGNFTKDRNTGEIRPLFTSPTGSFRAVGPADFAKIYNIPTGTLDGTGQTIAIVGRSNINVQDVKDFRTVFGLTQNFTSANVVLNGPDPGIVAGDEAESDLDVELSGGVAPGATIKFVTTESTQSVFSDGVDLSAAYIIENNLAGVMSISYGSCEAGIGATNEAGISAAWEQAAAQGITVVLSTGDNGSAGCDPTNANPLVATQGLAVSGLASTPFNAAVGGTDFDYSANPASFYWNTTNTNPGELSAKGYIPETPWNSSCGAGGSLTACASPHTIDSNGLDILAGSGGESVFNPQPSWQSTAITGITSDGHRHIPDVSFFAAVNSSSGNFYIICEADSSRQNGNTCNLTSSTLEFTGVGGTSASAPAFAGIVALLNQKVGGRVGNVNYGLYALAKAETFSNCNSTSGPGSTCVFNDVTKGNIAVACQGNSPNCSSTTTAVGVTTTAKGGTTLAYGTNAGYDLATGLGSVNVTNLTNQWSTVGLKASTTTITQSPSGTLSHNTNQTFKVSVTGTGGPPSGDVSLIAEPSGSSGPQVSLGMATLSGGTATITTNLLPGGTNYPVVAHYGGDGTFAGSDSVAASVSVNQENSKTTPTLLVCGTSSCSTSATTVTYGSPYILRVDVTNAAGTACNPGVTPCPTGNVILTDNGAPLDFGMATLNNLGYLEDQPIQLGGGSNAIVAAYAGDSSYNASTGSLTVTVTPAATQVTGLAASPASGVTTTTPVVLTATMGSGSNSALGLTGTVTFFNGGVQIGSPAAVTPIAATSTVTAGGTATLTTTFTTPGSKTITATYNGDTNYALSSASAITVTVTSSGSFTVSYNPNPDVLSSATGAGASTTVTVTPTGGFTGSVTVVCPAAANLPPGVTCTAPAPINITSANPVQANLTLSVAATSTTLSASAAPAEQKLYVAGMIPPGAGKGWWAISGGTGLAAIFLLLLPGRKRYRAALGLGLVCVLSFTLGCGGYGGGGGGGGGAVATITKISVPAPGKVASGGTFAFSATVTGGTPAGQVQLFDNGIAIGTAVTVSSGSAAITSPVLAVGTHAISAHYLGDAYTQASQSGSIDVTVTGATTVTITTNPVATPSAPAINVTVN